MSETELKMLYRDCDQTLKEVLRGMCNWGFIYLGRTGAGLTHTFRKEWLKLGGKAIEQHASQLLGEHAKRLLEVICVEGPKWVPYTRLEDALYDVNPFQKASTTIKKNNNKPPKTKRRKSVKKKKQQEEDYEERLRITLGITKE